MPPPVELQGRAAAPGIAAGPLFRLDRAAACRRAKGDPAAEAQALGAAIAAAVADLSALMAAAEGDGADILAFQVAMLEDEALSAPAFAAIAAGEGAEAGWSAALDQEIAGYEGGDDPHFQARGADLRDLRDRVLRHLLGLAEERPPAGAILAGEDVTPSRFLESDWSRGGGIALQKGSPSSHVAMLARARGVPMVVGLGRLDLDSHAEAIVDGAAGTVVLSPSEAERRRSAARAGELAEAEAQAAAFLPRPAATAGGEPVTVLVNVAGTDELDRIDPAHCDGIGLMRSEFLFRDGAPLPDEETQYRAYRRFLEWAGGKPVTIRTLDAGGDKPIGGLTPAGEGNPFLGLRGLRLSLARPEVFRVQLRALARAAVHGTLKVMVPMVTAPAELAAAAAHLDAAVAEARAAGHPAARPPLGMMVEVPAAAIAVDLFPAAAFLSIGSNDLVQYVTAAARDEESVAEIGDPSHPAVLRLIAAVVAEGRRSGREVSLCGDMAGDPAHVPALVAAGLRVFSVAASRLGPTKAALAATGAGDG